MKIFPLLLNVLPISIMPTIVVFNRGEILSTYSLAQRAALADGNPVTFLDTECRRDVSGDILVPLLVTVVLGDVVEVFAADDDGTVHLGRDNTAGEDTATDGDLTGEGALLVCSDNLAAEVHRHLDRGLVLMMAVRETAWLSFKRTGGERTGIKASWGLIYFPSTIFNVSQMASY